jgi:hypothetical protein
MRLFESQIATNMADNLLTTSDVKLGNYVYYGRIMSKRFGRNRKRALLLKLQQSENKTIALKNELDHRSEVDNKYYEIIDIISTMIPNSCMIEVNEMKGTVKDGVVKLASLRHLNLNEPLAIEVIRTLDLYHLELSIERHKNTLERTNCQSSNNYNFT